MDNLNWLTALIGGLGIGSVVSSLLSHWVSAKKDAQTYRRDKKEEAYLGLLAAYSDAMQLSNEENRINFLHSHLRVQLFGSQEVDKLIRDLYSPELVGSLQVELREKIISAMRKDLRVSD